MKPYAANYLNGFILLIIGAWGYLATESASPTALIAPVSGLIFLLLGPMMKNENKVVAHVVVLLTLLLMLALIVPLTKREGIAMVRILIMMLSCLIAMAIYIKSFIEARKAK